MIEHRNQTLLKRIVFAGLLLTLMIGGVWAPHPTVNAQDNPNLLTNGGLERPYYGQASATQTAPQGWTLWVGGGNPEAFPHNDPVQVLDGADSWNIHQGYTAFIAAGYQRVGGLTQGDALEMSAYGWAYTCNDTTNSCVIPEAPYRRSDTAAGVSMKVGIDPTGGTDPYAASVQWSGSAAPYDQWARLSVSAAAQGDTVTVFLFASQQAGLALNNVYWDNASLVRTNGVTVNASGTPIAAAPAQQAVFSVAQPPRPDGSIIHTVRQGDTLSGITYAYSEYGVTIQSIADLNEAIETNTRFLTVGQQIVILPPGSVDPETGDLLSPGQTLPTAVTNSGTPASGTTPAAPSANDPDAQSTRIPTPTPMSALPATPTLAPQVTAAPTVTRSMGWLRPLPAVPPQPVSMAEPADEVAQAIPTHDADASRQLPLALDSAADESASDATAEPPLGAAVALAPTATIPFEAAIATATPQVPIEAPTQADAVPSQPTALPPTVVDEAAAQPSATPQVVAAAADLTNGKVCVTMYVDANQNLVRDADEVALPQGEVSIGDETGSAENQTYTQAADPLCIDLLPGRYTVAASVPEGYGLTTTNSVSVQVAGGRDVLVMFGGVENPQPTAAPQAVADTGRASDDTNGAAAPQLEADSATRTNKPLADSISDNIGLILIGLAGLIVVGSGTLFLLMRRPER